MDNNYKYTLNEDNILFLMELIKNNKGNETGVTMEQVDEAINKSIGDINKVLDMINGEEEV